MNRIVRNTDMKTARKHYMPYVKFHFIVAILLLTGACSLPDDMDRDILRYDASKQNVSYVLHGRSISFDGAIYSSITAEAKLPVELENRAKSDEIVYAKYDPSLINTYNNMYRENNQLIPETAFEASNEGIFLINSEHTVSNDSLSVVFKDATGLKDGGIYLVPIRLFSESGVPLKKDILYFKVRVSTGELNARFTGGNSGVPSAPAVLRGGSISFDYNYLHRHELPDELFLGVALNTSFSHGDVKIGASALPAQDAIDFAKIHWVRNWWQTAVAFPEETYEIVQKPVVVHKGNYAPSDSIILRIKNKEKFISSQNHVLGLKISQPKDERGYVSPTASDSSKVFVKITLF